MNCVSSFPIHACSLSADAWPLRSQGLAQSAEDEALSWIEAVSEFDAPESTSGR